MFQDDELMISGREIFIYLNTESSGISIILTMSLTMSLIMSLTVEPSPSSSIIPKYLDNTLPFP